MLNMFSINEMEIYEDQIKEYDILKKIITTADQEDAFYILDLGIIIKKHLDWIKKMPRVVPYYAVKCNSNPMVIKLLAAMNANFDCASKQEIQDVMQLGILPDRIIFANPTKCPSHIKFAKNVGVDKMTVDGKLELFKIKKLFPEAKIIIRFRCDSKFVSADSVNLGIKFGCNPDDEAKKLIQLTKDLGLILYGFSFHVGSPCKEFNAYKHGIEICKELITFAKSIGCKDIKLIDIGGGFPGESGIEINELPCIINDAIKEIDPTIEIPASDKQYLSTICGPTCNSFDCIIKDVLLPEFHIGDWLVWSNMGSYTNSISFEFCGYMPLVVHPFIRKSQWQDFCAFTRCDINNGL
uniref:ornithine decarboxylase-like isoform X2 n=1 Tax=Vespula vulgaris TaxID=7454 RepID=UPI00223BA076|nr:ornithine decarboxylase-like isoform X2 [Vespula vulgaris]